METLDLIFGITTKVSLTVVAVMATILFSFITWAFCKIIVKEIKEQNNSE